MTPRSRFLHLAALALLPVGIASAETIAATDFNGRTLPSSNTASNLNWTLNGVDDPGDMDAFNAGGGAQALFDTTSLAQNTFIPGLNTGNGNTFWTTGVSLTVASGSAVTLTNVTFDYWAVNGGQAQNVLRGSDFTITLTNPSSAVVDTVTIADVLNGSTPDLGTPVTINFTAPIALTAPGTYTLEIKGGDFTGTDETGNHTGIDNLSINGATGDDNTAPTPDPMTFAVPPTAAGQFAITMTATTATDDSGVEYLFTNTTLVTDSAWQDSTEWTDTGLTAGTEYFYTVTARDKSGLNNATAASTPVAATTAATDILPPTPDPMTFAVPPAPEGQFSISMTATIASDDSGVEYLFTNTTLTTESGWQDSTEWTDTGLTADTEYFYTVTARDKSPAQNQTAASPPAAATTDDEDLFPPLPDPMTFAMLPTRVDGSSITMTATTATDESGIEYLFTNTTLATDSGWQASPTWTDIGLAPNTTYSYTVTARDTSPSQWETLPSPPASVYLAEIIIAATNFDGRTLTTVNIANDTATNLTWTLNGVEDPGDMTAFKDPGTAAQSLFDGTSLTQNSFAPALNTGNANTWWRTSVDLTVSTGSAGPLSSVTFDYWAINGTQTQNVARSSDFTVTLYDPSDTAVGTASIVDVINDAGATPGVPTLVVLEFPAPVALSAPGTYRLEIDGGELGGNDETGNHTGIDNLSINGSTGGGSGLLITDIALSGGNVVLTTNVAAAGLTPQISQDFTTGGFGDVDGGMFSVTGTNEITIDSSALTPPSDYFRVRN